MKNNRPTSVVVGGQQLVHDGQDLQENESLHVTEQDNTKLYSLNTNLTPSFSLLFTSLLLPPHKFYLGWVQKTKNDTDTC